jgi:hypothetical protein
MGELFLFFFASQALDPASPSTAGRERNSVLAADAIVTENELPVLITGSTTFFRR